MVAYVGEINDCWELFRDVPPSLLGIPGVIGTYCNEAFGSKYVYDLRVYPFINYLDIKLLSVHVQIPILTLVTSPSMYSAVWRSLVASQPSMKNVSLSAVVMWIVYTEDGFLMDPPSNVSVRLRQVRRKSV